MQYPDHKYLGLSLTSWSSFYLPADVGWMFNKAQAICVFNVFSV